MLVLAWCELALVAAVTGASGKRFARSGDYLAKKSTPPDLDKSLDNAAPHTVKKLGTNQIQSLLHDLDLQTSASEDAEEIGSDLLSGRLVKEIAVAEENSQEELQDLADSNSRIAPADSLPVVIKDDSGTPGKTTAKENGISYLTGEPVWIEGQLVRTNSGSGNDESFLFYPIKPDDERVLNS